MYDTTTEPYTPYEQACSRYVDDLYRTACLVLADADAAEKLVTEICTAGVHQYGQLADQAEIRFRLISQLYRRLKRRLRFCTPGTDALPEPLRHLTKQERLIAAMRFSAGLSPAEYRKLVNDDLHKPAEARMDLQDDQTKRVK